MLMKRTWTLIQGSIVAATVAGAQQKDRVVRHDSKFLHDSTGVVSHVMFVSPGAAKDVKLTAPERAIITTKLRALGEALSDQPFMQPPRGFNGRFMGSVAGVIGTPGPAPIAQLKYGLLFGAFELLYESDVMADGRVQHKFSAIDETELTTIDVNVLPSQFDAAPGAPLYDPDWQVFARPEVHADLGGFPLLSNKTLIVTHLDLDKIMRPVSVERMLKLYQVQLVKYRDDQLKALASAAESMKRQQTPTEIAAQKAKFAAAMARYQNDRSSSEDKKQKEIKRLQEQWDKDNIERQLVIDGDPNGPLGAPYREARDSLTSLDRQLATMSADQRNAPACGGRQKLSNPLDYTSIHAVGAPACFPIVEQNRSAFRSDLPRTAMQTIRIDVGLCRVKAATEVARKTQSHACQSAVHMLGSADWKKVEAMLEP